MSRHPHLPQESTSEVRAASRLSSRWLRLSAATVAVLGGIMAASTAAEAWAAQSAVPSASSASAAALAPEARVGDAQPQERRGRFCNAKHGGGMAHGGMPGLMPGGRHLERMLDQVQATDAQREKIHAIADAARQDLGKLRAEGRTLHEQSMGLMTQAQIDPAAAEALRQKMLAHHDIVSKRMQAAMLETAQVLTPEQRATLAEHMKQRQQRHESWREHGRVQGGERHGHGGLKG
jgi:periplasmic protein CpxP/Spy